MVFTAARGARPLQAHPACAYGRAGLALAVLACAVAGAPAAAQVVPAGALDAGRPGDVEPGQSLLLSAGGQIDFSRSGYVGATVPLPGGGIGRGLAVRASGFGGDYTYDSSSRRIDGSFWGGQLEGVYQLTRPGAWLDLAAGVRYVDTSLTPFDRGNRRHGSQAEPEFSTDGGLVRGPWRTDFYGSYGTRLEDYAVRASLTHNLTSRLRGGGEVSFEGDPTYDLQRVGPYVGYYLDRRSELQLSAGVSHQSGQGEGGFLRVQLYRTF